MVESGKRTNTGEIKAAEIERDCGGLGSKSQGLGRSILVLVADKAGLASIVNGAEPLAGMEWDGGSRGRRPVRGWHGAAGGH